MLDIDTVTPNLRIFGDEVPNIILILILTSMLSPVKMWETWISVLILGLKNMFNGEIRILHPIFLDV